MTRKEAADVFRDVVIHRVRPDVPDDVAEAMAVVLDLIGNGELGPREPRGEDDDGARL